MMLLCTMLPTKSFRDLLLEKDWWPLHSGRKHRAQAVSGYQYELAQAQALSVVVGSGHVAGETGRSYR